ncbi:MAG: FeoA family protein [Candidatus Omnitrophota bacterium]
MEKISLIKLATGRSGIVIEISGDDAGRRLGYLGIRPGKRITKISSHFWGGPVTVRVDKSKVAIGHGIARKIIVEAEI